MDDDTEEDFSRASTPAPAEATEDSAASANIDSLPASAEGTPTQASCEGPSQESTTQGNWWHTVSQVIGHKIIFTVVFLVF